MAKKTPSKVTKTNLNSVKWFANVAKSLGYSSVDVISGIMPATKDTISENADFVKETAQTLREITKSKNAMMSAARRAGGTTVDEYLLTGAKAWTNIKEDLKSGNINNKERAAKYSNMSTFGDEDFSMDDFDNDDNWSLDDFDVEKDYDNRDSSSPEVKVSVTPKINLSSNINGNNPMVRAVASQTDLMVDIAKDTANRDLKLSTVSMAMNQKLILGVQEHLGVINENLSRLLDFNSSTMSKFASASVSYYDESIALKHELLEELRKFNEFNSPKKEVNYTESELPFNSYTGVLDFRAYSEMIKKNAKNMMMDNMLFGSAESARSMGGLEMLAANPLKFVSNWMVQQLIPSSIKSNMSKLDSTVSGFFPALLAKVTSLKDSSNPLLSMIGEALGVSSNLKSSVDTRNYERGKVDFDGITRKSIVEVIPGYLSKILFTLTGGKERLTYDYNEGKFTTYEKMRKTFNNNMEYSVLNEFNPLSDFLDSAEAFDFGDEEFAEEFKDKIRKGFLNYASSNIVVNPEEILEERNLKNIFSDITDPLEQRILKNMISVLSRGEKERLFAGDKLSANIAKSRFFANEEAANLGSPLHNDLYKDHYGSPSVSFKAKTRSDFKTAKEWEEYQKQNEWYNLSRQERGVTSIDDFDNLTDEEIAENIKKYNRKHSEYTKSESFFSKLFKRNGKKDGIGGFIEKTLEAPVNAINKLLETVDKGLYSIIFPSKSDKEKGSFFDKIKKSISDNFKIISDKVSKFYDDIKEKLFGEEGIFTKFSQSETWKKAKAGFNKGVDFAFGKADKDGYRKDGFFSDVFNSMKDMGKSFMSYFTGNDFINSKGETINGNKEGSVFGIFKDQMKSFYSSVSTYIFGDKSKEERDKSKESLFSGLTGTFRRGTQNWLNAIFGEKTIKTKDGEEVENKNYLDVSEFTNKVKQMLPKGISSGLLGGGIGILASIGGFGILGSMFLGPMSGAVIGLTAGLLSQSDRFKNWLFGEKDDETGERAGGFLSKQSQKFFKDNKDIIIGGATIGGISGALGLGILPSFILGGPVTGALFGIATGLLTRSESFRNLFFGAKDTIGDKASGLIDKFNKKFASTNKDALGTIGVGAIGGLGIGSMLSSFGLLGGLAFGPFSGAIAGAAAGIALTSDRWKSALFGDIEVDEQGKSVRKGGLISKFGNYLQTEVLEPFKVTTLKWSTNVQNWFDEKIAVPFAASMEPIKVEFDRLKERIKGVFSNVAETIMKIPGVDVVIDTLKKFNPMKPFVKAGEFLIEKTSAMFSKVLEAPVKVISLVSEKLYNKHMKEGIKHYRQLIWNELKNRVKESAIVKDVMKPFVIDPFKKLISDVGSFAKATITETFSLTGKLLKGFLGLTTKTITTAVTAPFKAIALPFQLMGMMKPNALKTPDANIMDKANNLGSLSFTELLSIGAKSFLPGATRQSFASSEYGAPYAKTWKERYAEAMGEADKRKEERNRKLQEAQAKLAEKQAFARASGYTSIKSDVSFTEYMTPEEQAKAAEKAKKSAYGKQYKSMSVLDKDRFTMEMNNSKGIFNIHEAVEKIKELMGINNKLTEKSNALLANTSDEFKEGLDAFDEENDAEEAKAVSFAQKNEEDESLNLEHIREQNEKREEKKQRKSFFDTMKNLVSGIKDNGDKQRISWDSIFSKKGLITAGLLIALPWLMDFLKDPAKKFGTVISNALNAVVAGIRSAIGEFLGNKDDDGDRTTEYGDVSYNADAAETMGTAATTGAVRGIHTFGHATYKALGLDKPKATAPYKLASDGSGRWVDPKTGKFVKTKMATKAVEEFDAAQKANETTLQKFINLGRSALDAISNFLKKKAPNAYADVTKVLTKVRGTLVVSKLAQLGSSFKTRISGAVTKFFGSALSAGIVDLGFMTYGAISGVTKSETANLFNVEQEDVTGGMQTVSAIIKSITSSSYGSIVALISDIVKALIGFDLITTLAEIIYAKFGGDGVKLVSLQQEFDAAYEKNKMLQVAISGTDEDRELFKSIQAKEEQLKANPALKDDVEFMTSLENSRSLLASKSNYSKDAYNDTVNKTVFSKIKGGLSNAKRFMFGNKGDEEALAQAEDFKLKMDAFAKANPDLAHDPEFIKMLENVNNTIKENQATKGIFGSVFSKIANVGSSIKNLMSILSKDRDNQLNAAKSGGDFTKGFTVVDGSDPTSGLQNALIKTNYILGIPSAAIVSIGKTLGDKAKSLINWFGQVGNVGLYDSKSGLQVAMSGGDMTSSDYWTAPVDDSGNPASGFRQILFSINRVATFLPYMAINLGVRTGRKISELWGKLKQVGSTIKDDFSSGLQMAMSGTEMYGSGYWEAPMDDSGNPASGFRTGLFVTNRLLTFLPFTAVNIVSRAANALSPVWDNIKSAASSIKDDFSSGLQMALSGSDMGSSNYWEAPTDDSGSPVSGFRKGLFIANRVLTFLPFTAVNLGAKIGKSIGPVWDSIKSAGANLKTYVNADSSLSISEYWKYSGSGESAGNVFDKILFYGARILMSPMFYIKKMFNFVGNGLKSAGSWIKDKLSKVAEFFNLDGQAGAGGITPRVKRGSANRGGIPTSESKFKDKLIDEFNKQHQGGAVADQYNNYRKYLTSDFGYRNDPFTGKRSGHEGVDMAKGLGTPIGAFVPGTVIAANHVAPGTNDAPSGKGKGYGNNVIIKDKYGKLHLYAHMNSISVQEGQNVELGQTVGTEGSTGRSTGSHLHYSVMDGKFSGYSDPNKYIEGYDSGNPNLSLSSEYGTVNPTFNGTDATSETGNIITGMTGILNNLLSQTGLTSASSALNSSTDATSSGTINTNLPDGETADKVWQFFTQNGYSKAATASIMGNLYAESGMNPARIQEGSGHAAGIAQWESYKNKAGRWLNMSKFAASRGKDWTDLASQLEFMHNELSGSQKHYFTKGSAMQKAGAPYTTYEAWKQSTNVDTATRQFEGAFERAGIPHMDRRLAAARGYYEKYGKTSLRGSAARGGLEPGLITVKSRIPDSDFEFTAPKDLFKQNFTTAGKGGLDTLVETVANTAKSSGDDTLVNNLVKIVSLLGEIATNTRKTTENTANIVNKEANTTVVSTSNNISSNPMFDIARQRKEEKTKSNYAMAKAVAQGIH